MPANTPNMNAYIESFHSIPEDECYGRHEFETFADTYETVSHCLHYYNYRCRHGSIKYMAPVFFYHNYLNQTAQTAA